MPKHRLKNGVRVSLDMTTLTIMRVLPREVDPMVYNMSTEDPGDVSFAGIGGLTEQVRELREVIELPLQNPELFLRVGIKPPKGVLLYGPPGTGKTLLAKAVAKTMGVNFLKVVSSAIVDKYIGESARLVREMFGYAKEHEPCIIFMDEVDAIGGRRLSEGTSADREIQRTLMEVCLRSSSSPVFVLLISLGDDSFSTKWMVSMSWDRPRSSWPPTDPTPWIRPYCVPVVLTERSKFLSPTKSRAKRSCRSTRCLCAKQRTSSTRALSSSQKASTEQVSLDLQELKVLL